MSKVFFSIALLVASANTVFAQQKTDDTANHSEDPKGLSRPAAGYSIPDYLAEHIHYPRSARDSNIEGRVVIKFLVNELGDITHPEILKGTGSSCDLEALRVVSAMPRWKPGTFNGKPVKVFFTLPVSFMLDNEPKKSSK